MADLLDRIRSGSLRPIGGRVCMRLNMMVATAKYIDNRHFERNENGTADPLKTCAVLRMRKTALGGVGTVERPPSRLTLGCDTALGRLLTNR